MTFEHDPQGNQRAEYDYDILGRRTGKRVWQSARAQRLKESPENRGPEETVQFCWNGLRLAGEKSSKSAHLTLHYVYNSGSYNPLARIESFDHPEKQTTDISYYHIALNGLPEEVTDSQGRIIWHGDYSLWGKLKREQHPEPGFRGQQNLRFQGQYFDRETGLHYNTFRYYAPDTGRFTQQDPIGLMGGLNLYQYAPNTLTWVDPWGLSCTGKMQPYRFDDVRVKGPHLDISVNGGKITEAKLGLDKSGNLVWERFGDMKGASNKLLNQADKYIGDLMGNQKIMGQAKTQITQTMDDFKRILSDPSSSKNSIGLAERGIDKFSKMLEKFNELN